MKISKVVNKSYQEIVKQKPYDMFIKPKKQKFYLRPVTKLLSFGEIKECNLKINKINMDNKKGPYLILCNHNSFIDFKVLTKAIYPQPANYIVAIDGFINREWLLRNVGCICKRKFLNDVNIVRQISYSLKTNKYICALYPEARYSHVGTTAILPISLAKMVKILGFPVVTLICHGNHLRQPVWNLGYKRKVDITADMTYLFDENEIKDLSIEEINNKIQKAFNYNDYQYQLDNNILIKEEIRALGLERVLYKCPHCHNEESMKSTGTTIYCEKCEKEYVLMENGNLRCINGETLFNNIPAWYEWERECVKKEVEDGTYSVNVEVDADDLRNSKGFYRFGRGILNHNLNGFYFHANVDNEDFVLTKSPLENYSAHVEYAYFGRGDAISFSTKDDSYYFFPVDNRNIVTKLHFGVEEVFKYTKNKMNNKDE